MCLPLACKGYLASVERRGKNISWKMLTPSLAWGLHTNSFQKILSQEFLTSPAKIFLEGMQRPLADYFVTGYLQLADLTIAVAPVS